MKWFRFYHDALDDPKVQRLPDRLFKLWVNLLCVANEGSPRGTLPCIADIAFRLRLTEKQASSIMRDFIDRGLIDETSAETLQPHNWSERQYDSDDVTSRVQKHRSKPDGNVSETFHETPPDTEQIQIQNRADTEDVGTRVTSVTSLPLRRARERLRAFGIPDDKLDELFGLFDWSDQAFEIEATQFANYWSTRKQPLKQPYRAALNWFKRATTGYQPPPKETRAAPNYDRPVPVYRDRTGEGGFMDDVYARRAAAREAREAANGSD